MKKCGACYGEFNIFPRVDDINVCSGGGNGDGGEGYDAVPCGVDKKKKKKKKTAKGDENEDEMKYPMCIWDGKKNEPRSICGTISKVEHELEKKGKKDDGDMLLDCGFCDESKIIEGK